MSAPAPAPSPAPAAYRFGIFEFHTDTLELRRQGGRVRLAQQPAQLLHLLLAQAGELVGREEIKHRLWPPETFVDFDNSVNSAMNRIRQALRDSADHPRYIETHPRLGYKFIAPVTPIYAATAAPVLPAEPPAVTQMAMQTAVIHPAEAAFASSLRPVFSWWSIRLGLGLAAVVLVLAMGAVWWSRRPRPQWPRLISYTQITRDHRLKIGHNYLSPLLNDGLRIYFSEYTRAGDVLMSTGLDGGAPQPLPSLLPNLRLQAISPGGLHLLVTQPASAGGQLWVLDLPSGAPHAMRGVAARAACWSPHGRRIAYAWHGQIRVLPAAGGPSRLLVRLASTPWWLRWSPEGRRLRFTLGRYDGDNDRIWQILLDANPPHAQALTGPNVIACCGDWTGDGADYFYQTTDANGSNISVLPRHAGHGRNLTAGPLSYIAPEPVRGTGRLLAIGQSISPELMRYDRRRRRFLPYLQGIAATWVTFSPHRRRVAYALAGRERSVWVARADDAHAHQITFPPFDCEGLAWSPHGRRLLIRARLGMGTGQPWRLYIYIFLRHQLQLLHRTGRNVGIANWSPHGRRLVYGDLPGSTGQFPVSGGIHIYDVAHQRLTTLPGSVGLWTARWSSNGRWIAALRDHSQRLMLYSWRRRQWRTTTIAPVDNPTWSRRGRHLYFDSLGANLGFYRFNPVTGRLRKVVSLNRFGWLSDGWSGLDGKNQPLVARVHGLDEIYSLNWQ